MTFRTIIADDEQLSVDMLQVLLSEIQPSIEAIDVIAVCGTGSDTLVAVADLAPDLLFLDINMPAGDGISVADALYKQGKQLPLVIFTTAHAEHAAHAFEIEAVDYLLKPIQAERLQRALERAAEARKSADAGSARKMIAVPVLGGIEMIEADTIEWAEACGDYVRLHAGSRNFLIRKTLSAFAGEMSPTLRQTHRSYMINPNHVTKVIPKAKGEAILCVKSGSEIPVSRSHRDVLQNLLT